MFKTTHSLEKRLKEANAILVKYPDRIPVIVEKADKNDPVPDLDRHKYLVPNDLTVGQFLYVIRKRIKLSQENALYLFVNNTLPPVASLISEIYKEHHDEDKFLYFVYKQESTFG